MFIRSLLICCCVASGATFSVVPAFNSDCALGLGTATITWSGATGLVQIRVGQSNGPALTAFTNPSGSATTGRWVNDGMTFYLVDQAGTVEASATAHLSCGGTPRTIDHGLAGGSYFPLAVGNTWVYKANSRLITASYLVRSITDTQIIAGQTYYVLSQNGFSGAPATTVALLRADANGVVYQNINGVDKIYFDPTAASTQRTGYSGPLGSFNDALKVTPPAFIETTSTYVRGIGLANAFSIMLSGSSGGFTDGLDLVEVRVDGVHLSVPAPKIGLFIENTELDLTGQLAPNCAVPCYYPACGLGFPYDLPGIYRPCAQTRIETSCAAAGYTILLQLLDAAGSVVFQNSSPALSATSLGYIRLPLYTETGGYNPPFRLLPPGDYQLVGSIVNSGTTQAQSSINVHIH